jgi:hypothetical protein
VPFIIAENISPNYPRERVYLGVSITLLDTPDNFRNEKLVEFFQLFSQHDSFILVLAIS